MTCESANNAIMQYQEKRIKPLKSIALHRHIIKCETCKTLFLAMDDLQDLEIVEPQKNFTQSVMKQIEGVKGTSPLAGYGAEPHGLTLPILTLAMALALVILDVPADFLGSLVQAGQVVVGYTTGIINANYVFVAAVALVMTAVGIDLGKNTET